MEQLLKPALSEEEKIIKMLIRIGRERLEAPRTVISFETGITEAEVMLNDLKHFPHHFLLACVMDRQVRASRAWSIPYHVGRVIGGFSFNDFQGRGEDHFVQIFTQQKLHRFNAKMATLFFHAIQHIAQKYDGHAAAMWERNPKSATVIRRFLELKGVGIKIANMATNILARDFKVPMLEHSSIDIAPDVQVQRFFAHHNLLRPQAGIDELIYRAREIYPEYPGILDIGAWELGRKLR